MIAVKLEKVIKNHKKIKTNYKIIRLLCFRDPEAKGEELKYTDSFWFLENLILFTHEIDWLAS